DDSKVTNSCSMATPTTSQINLKRTALIIVDVQNDFMPGGSLAIDVHTPENERSDTEKQVDEYTEKIVNLAKNLKSKGCKIVTTRDWHPSDHLSFMTEGGIWPVHCVQNKNGSKYADQRLDELKEIEVLKGISHRGNGYSGFGDLLDTNIPLAFELKKSDIDTLIVCGVATDFCVKSTAGDGAKITFDNLKQMGQQYQIVSSKLSELGKTKVEELTREESAQLWLEIEKIPNNVSLNSEKAFPNVYVASDLIHHVSVEGHNKSIRELDNLN
ncbi:hypothetical protein HK096_008875, partial [Nowakowskiella sp. JEL0078]